MNARTIDPPCVPDAPITAISFGLFDILLEELFISSLFIVVVDNREVLFAVLALAAIIDFVRWFSLPLQWFKFKELFL